MTIHQLENELKSLYNVYPDADIVSVEAFLENNQWKYKINFYHGEDLAYIVVKEQGGQ